MPPTNSSRSSEPTAGALLLAALAYSFARHHAHDPRFAFGTGKLGHLAGFSSAIILAMIALLSWRSAACRSPTPSAGCAWTPWRA